jgi:hypothetical protein
MQLNLINMNEGCHDEDTYLIARAFYKTCYTVKRELFDVRYRFEPGCEVVHS